MSKHRSNGFDRLMDIACPGYGYCGCFKNDRPLHVTDFIPPSGPVTADQFVEWLMLADNVNPNQPRQSAHKAALRSAFVECMGSAVVDASKLQWTFDDDLTRQAD